MKNGFKIAFVYIGLVIGAGFASGKEVMHFFNRFGDKSYHTIFLAMFLFIFIAYIIMKKVMDYNIYDFSEYVNIVGGRFNVFFKIIIILFMFCGFCVMICAGGSVIENIFSINKSFGIWGLLIICFVVFMYDAKGIVVVNTVLVPIMILGITYISINSYLLSEEVFLQFFLKEIKCAGDNFFVSAILYVSYNTITAASVLIPLKKYFTDKSIKTGAHIGGLILGFLIFIIWLVIKIHYKSVSASDMPMLDIAEKSGIIYKCVYGAILYMAIITTAVSEGFGILSHLNLSSRNGRGIKAFAICIIAAPVAYFGFSSLVENLYTLFGYLGILWIIVIFWDYIKNSAMFNKKKVE